MKKKTVTIKKESVNQGLLILQEFSRNLQKAVSDTGLTPYALAKEIGLDKDSIKNVMSGDRDPKFSSVLRVIKGMRLSMDELIGNISVSKLTPAKPAPAPAPAPQEVEIKKGNIDFISRIVKMNEQDVELLEAIAHILDERRIRAIARLFNAVQDSSPSEKSEKKGGLMAKASEMAKEATGALPDELEEGFEDGFEDDDFDEDDDFEDDEDFEDEDENFHEDDDFGDDFSDD
jgi:hypothetical protein